MITQTQAIVLRLSDFREADRIVTLLTLDYGKVSAIALGAKRSHKRFGAALAPFGWGEAALKQSRASDLWGLDHFHSAKGFPHLCDELGRFSQASYASELCQELCSPHHPEPQIFALLLQFLHYLNDLPLSQKPKLEPVRVFELRILDYAGLKLSLDRCVECGRGLQEESQAIVFDNKRGGVVCESCGHSVFVSGSSCKRLSVAARHALVMLSQFELNEMALMELNLPKEVSFECRALMIDFIQYYLGKSLRTVEFALQFG